MKRRCLILLSYLLCIFMFGILGVKADGISVYNENDYYQFTFSKSNVRALSFYIQDATVSTDYNKATLMTADPYNATVSSNVANVSLQNGSYKVWVYGTDYKYYSQTISVKNSCTNEPKKTNQTGSFTVERCFKKYKASDGTYKVDIQGETPVYSCADGYMLTESALTENTCSSMNLNGMSYRWCKGVFKGTCTKKSSSTPPPPEPETPAAPAATLSALSVSSGKLSPAFKSGTTKYTVNVGAEVSSIKVNATASSGNSLVSGYGSRTVDLKYGANSIKVKVKNKDGKTKTYTITVNRADNRSTVNTLSNLTVSAGTLSPVFSSSVNDYTVDVGYEVSSITIDATLTDSKSRFANNFGPSTVALQQGINKIYIKVVSENEVTNVYSVTVNRGELPSECVNADGKLALVKGIELYGNTADDDNLIDFTLTPGEKNYSNIKIPYNVSDLVVIVYTEDEADKEFVQIEGNENLVANENREVTINITSNVCPNYTNKYTLNVMREDAPELNTDATLKNLTIKGYDLKFEPNVMTYEIVLKKKDKGKSLDIEPTPKVSTTTCVEEKNEKLAYGSEIVIRCTAEDEDYQEVYTIVIDDVEKGTNIFLIVILVIIIIIILIYLVLRLLGYRIYFNTAMIGSFFRGMGEKAKNTFDK